MVKYLNKRSIVKKKIKLRDIFVSSDKNIYRTNFFFNYGKYRHKKWKLARSYKNFEDTVIFKRYAPNISYIPKYSYIITANKIDGDNIKIDKFNQYLTYKSRLFLKKRLMGFYRIHKTKLLKKFLVFRHMSTHFNVFDTNYEILLIRFGLADGIKEARHLIKCGVLKINNFIVNQTRHLNHMDVVQFSSRQIIKKKSYSVFSIPLKKFVTETIYMKLNLFNHFRLLLQERRMPMDIKKNPQKNSQQNPKRNLRYELIGFLPFISVFNFSNFSFLYHNRLMKNQWHFFIDFYIAKKFIKYNR